MRIVLEVVKLAPVFDKKDARHEDEEQETSGASNRRHHHQVAAVWNWEVKNNEFQTRKKQPNAQATRARLAVRGSFGKYILQEKNKK